MADADYIAYAEWCRAESLSRAAMWADEIERHTATGRKRFRCGCNDYRPCDFHFHYAPSKGN